MRTVEYRNGPYGEYYSITYFIIQSQRVLHHYGLCNIIIYLLQASLWDWSFWWIYHKHDLIWLIHYSAFFGNEDHVALDKNPGPGCDTLLLRLIPGDLFNTCPHRQFHTLLGLLDSRAALPNSNHFMMVFGMTRQGREPSTFRVRGGHANH